MYCYSIVCSDEAIGCAIKQLDFFLLDACPYSGFTDNTIIQGVQHKELFRQQLRDCMMFHVADAMRLSSQFMQKYRPAWIVTTAAVNELYDIKILQLGMECPDVRYLIVNKQHIVTWVRKYYVDRSREVVYELAHLDESKEPRSYYMLELSQVYVLHCF